jgi:3-oxoacyl-[acyl-carrier protein] reductase
VAQTVAAFGRLDILVNNAGVATMAPITEFALADFDRLMAVNVRAVFVACQAAAAHLPDGGRIIQIGSVNADCMPFAGGSVYAMSKAAVAGFTRGLARDLGARGITVNNIQPGPVDTAMNPANGPFAESLKKLMALGRYGTGEEIAGLVSYLAGPDGGYVTGASLTVDGGFDA